MASTTLNTRIALKIDTAAAWASSSLVLLKGEVAIESDTRKFKIGDGVKTFAQLEYAAQLPNIVATTDPTTSDSGYDVGTIWINKTAGTSFYNQEYVPKSAYTNITGRAIESERQAMVRDRLADDANRNW